jgi:outer membrane protein assembly factor BamB
MSPWRARLTRRRIVIGAGVLAVLVIAAAAVAYAVLRDRQGNVNNPDVAFRAEPEQTTPPPPPPSPSPSKKPKQDPLADFEWPFYGFRADRRRVLVARLRPPFRRRWKVDAHVLLEFSPVIGQGKVFLFDDNARLRAIDKERGKVLWKRRLGVLAASAPGYADGRLYVTVLERSRGGAGRVVALRARDGKILWSRDLPSRAESSPLVTQGRVVFGSENGTVYALRASDGRASWRFRAAGAVKGGIALADRRLVFGDYAGHVYAVRPSSGKQVWQATTNGARLGFASGSFYATAAVAYGRVYLGNTDGFGYSFSLDSGQLAWRHKTAGYVYASAAVGTPPKGRPTVFVGSYDGTFYALDARSGKVRWSKHEGGAISGGSTLVGDIVYSANIRTKRTTGYSARTGRVVFTFPDGSYNPVVSDGRTIFLDGYKRIYALRPRAAGKAAR